MRVCGCRDRRYQDSSPYDHTRNPGIAWVNSVGILGGSVSPPIVGYLRDLTGNFTGGLYALALFGVGAALISAIAVRETPEPQKAQAVPAAAAAG
jgi:ACS family tartrate transporter-like MFS transporter